MRTILFCMIIAATSCAFGDGHRVLVADASKKRIAIVDRAGKIEWEYRIDDLHDLQLLESGNVLFEKSITHLVEVEPRSNKIVWEYDAQMMNSDGKKVEVHSFQRLADGVTMIAESGRARIIEVDRAGKILKTIRLKVEHPSTHSDTRLVRKVSNGNYLVAHEADGKVREYDGEGKVVWEYEVPLFGKEKKGGHGPEAWGNSVFSAIRLANGNIVLGNCHAGESMPQIVEIDRAKKVLWKWKDFEKFGNATSNAWVIEN